MNIAALLSAISLVKSGHNDKAVGAHGELGRYQISRVVWEQHSVSSFQLAKRVQFSRPVAERHISWLRRHLPNELRSDTFWIAAAWNCGLARVSGRSKEISRFPSMRIPKSTERFAAKVAREYQKQIRPGSNRAGLR